MTGRPQPGRHCRHRGQMWRIPIGYETNWSIEGKPKTREWAEAFLRELNEFNLEGGLFFSQALYEKFADLRSTLTATVRETAAGAEVAPERAARGLGHRLRRRRPRPVDVRQGRPRQLPSRSTPSPNPVMASARFTSGSRRVTADSTFVEVLYSGWVFGAVRGWCASSGDMSQPNPVRLCALLDLDDLLSSQRQQVD
jgi:hypothetical protein